MLVTRIKDMVIKNNILPTSSVRRNYIHVDIGSNDCGRLIHDNPCLKHCKPHKSAVMANCFLHYAADEALEQCFLKEFKDTCKNSSESEQKQQEAIALNPSIIQLKSFETQLFTSTVACVITDRKGVTFSNMV